MRVLKGLLNIGLSAKIKNLTLNNKQIGGFNKKVVVLCNIEYSLGTFYIKARSVLGDHLFGNEEVFLWKSRRFKTKEEAIGHLTKEVRIAQNKFPEIIFFKTERYVNGAIQEFDEYLEGEWIRSKHRWSWDPPRTMRDTRG